MTTPSPSAVQAEDEAEPVPVSALPGTGEARFTLVFAGDISRFKPNPFRTETPFGKCYAVGVGDAFEENNWLRERIEQIADFTSDKGTAALLRSLAMESSPVAALQVEAGTGEADREFFFTYRFAGAEWGISIFATDPAEAREKIKAVALARYDGEVFLRVPAAAGWFAKLIVALKNFRRMWRAP